MERNAAVLDDQFEDRKMLSFRLQDVGCSVVAGEDPGEFANVQLHVALVDMVFHGKYLGPEFCKEIRDQWPRCLIIAVSGVDEKEGLFRDAVSLGACCSLEKSEVTVGRLKEIFDIHWCPHHNPSA